MIYLDNNSTTRIDDRVLHEMIPFFVDNYANASSRHVEGTKAKKGIELARKRIGDVINADKNDIYFTSGSTEAINTIFKGVIETNQNRQKHIITVKTEHSAVIEVCRYLEKKGVDITFLDIDKEGLININELKSSLRESTVLVSVMLVNNEIGVIQNIGEISELLKKKNVLFFTDATQGFGKIPIDIKTCPVDFMCFSGHKIHGPKGIGGIYISENRMSKLEPLLWGGGQENNFRGGTSNVPAIVGFGLAAELAYSEMEINENKIKNLRNTLEDRLTKYNWVGVNGKVDRRTYNVSNLTFKDIEIEPIINGSLGIIASNGSACSSGSDKPSHVLKALGLSDKDTFSSIRFSMSKFNTEDEIIYAIGQIDNFIKSNYSNKSINY